MTERARILFVAGESGVGKTSACLAFQIYGPLLRADIISEKAGPRYFGNIDDVNTKVVLFAFAAGDGLAEHVAPLPAIIQIIKGEAAR